jgi:uncharacterized protein Veg
MGELGVTVDIVGRIKTDLEACKGSKMRLRANLGRCKVVEREGVLEETHPNLFVIRVEEKRDRSRRISYSYADVLTRTVELTHPHNGESVLPWLE